jgi:DNA repair exonuclease SbcCD nuclease subunit
MKLLITGDLHLDEKKPKNRIDNWMSAQSIKLVGVFDLAKKEKVSAILQPGDFFNTFKVSHWFIRHWIKFFKEYNIPILTVPGQHDMRYHASDIENTPMGVLEAAGVIKVLDDKGSVLKDQTVGFYGAGWKQDIPSPAKHNSLKVLVTHRLVSDSALWATMEYTTPQQLLQDTVYDLIVTGDNHKHFFYTSSRRTAYLINCGSLMRSAIDQRDHEPVVYIYDTETKYTTVHCVPIKPFTEVMNLEEVEKEKERNIELDSFVEGLSDTNIEGLDFKKNLIDHLEKNKDKIGQGVIDIINEVIG